MANTKTTTTTTTKKAKSSGKNGLGFVSVSKNMPNQIMQEYTPRTFGESYESGTYNSQYQPQIDAAMDRITNWNYDPLQDASYQALAKVYGQRGNIAAKNSLGDAAALNGGYGTSFAVSAAQQARNQYNQELASLVPELENAAYNRASTSLSALRDADNTAYGRFRDTESDRWNQYLQRYNQFRDSVGDDQWAYNNRYQQYRDAIADWQWAKNWNLDYDNHLYSTGQKTVKSKSSGGGGGGGGRSYGGGGYNGGSGGGNGGNDSDLNDYYKAQAKQIGQDLGKNLKGTIYNALGFNSGKKPSNVTAPALTYQPTPGQNTLDQTWKPYTNSKKK